MKFGIIATATCLLAERTHAQIVTRQKKRHQRRGLKEASSTTNTNHAGVTKRRKMMTDGVSSLSMSMTGIAGGSGSPMMAKSAKSSSSKSGKDKILTTVLGDAPGMEGFLNTAGTVTVRYNEDHDDGFFFLSLDAAGLDGNCAGEEGCRLAIKSGMTCNEATLMGDDYDASGENVWSIENRNTNYNTYNGVVEPGMDWFSNSAFRATNGYSMEENEGHAVVLYMAAGDAAIVPAWACGVLQASYGVTLEASMGSYPGYTGDLLVSGKVEVMYEADQTFKFKYSLSGLAADCENCGIHIHSGKSCNSHAEVMGHGWNSEKVQDLWTAAGGAVYNSDAYGNAEGYFDMNNGFSFGQNMHHAVVIHTAGGARVGCGVLEGVM